MKIKCSKCKIVTAVWRYQPSDITPRPYYCDACIKRGCSCNVNSKTGMQNVDKNGRLFPCCEYSYNKLGFNPRKNGD